jgi:HSP20 family protein
MELVKRNGEHNLGTAFQRQVERLFGDFFGEEFYLGRNGETFFPQVDLAETPEAVVVTAEVPGIDPKEVAVTVEKNRLIIHGEKKEEKETKEKHWHRVERRLGTFHRELGLPAEVEQDRIEAAAKNGVVRSHSPRRRRPKANKSPSKRRSLCPQRKASVRNAMAPAFL